MQIQLKSILSHSLLELYLLNSSTVTLIHEIQ